MIRASFFSLALLAAACTPPAETPPEEPVAETPAMPQTAAEATAQDTCGARSYVSMIGSNIAAIQLPADSVTHRVIMPDTVVTQDFRADRINFITDAQGVITSIECY